MERSIGRLVSILYRKNQVYLNVTLKQLDLTASELPVLIFLFRNHGVSQEELSSFLVIDKASTARVVQSLMEKGYLLKEKDSKDRRANKLFLTDLAIEQKSKIHELLYDWSCYLTDGIDEESVEIMFSVLEKMVKKVEDTDLREIWRKE